MERGAEEDLYGGLEQCAGILAKLPKPFRFAGDKVIPYLVFCNSHDGSGAIKVAMTPIRVVCNNTLNLALQRADRIWSANHTGDIGSKLEDARMTLYRAENYMSELSKEAERLTRRRVRFVYSAFIYPRGACGSCGL